MKITCFTGAPDIDFERSAVFLKKNLGSPENFFDYESGIGIEEWHEVVDGIAGLNDFPGELWNNIAKKIALSGFVKKESCAWAHVNALYFVDYWAEIDSRINFVLQIVSPKDFLAFQLYNGKFESVENSIEQWCKLHRNILKFVLKYPSRTLLVWSKDIVLKPYDFVSIINEKWLLGLDEINNEFSKENEQGFLLAQKISECLLYSYDLSSYSKLVNSLARNVVNFDGSDFYSSFTKKREAVCKFDKEVPFVEGLFIDIALSFSKFKNLESHFYSQKNSYDNMIADCEDRIKIIENKLSNVDEEKDFYLREYNKANYRLESIKSESERILCRLNDVQESWERSLIDGHEALEKEKLVRSENLILNHKVKKLEEFNENLSKSWFKKIFLYKQAVCLEYEGIQLQHEQVNPDYEHLWISLQAPKFGLRTVKNWHFRISCAGVEPGFFGLEPKLEIPEQREQMLSSWFAESESDNCAKLELRFALPGSMDTNVWRKIKAEDKEFLVELLKQLPMIFEILKIQGNCISRDWNDWLVLAENIKRIHQNVTKF